MYPTLILYWANTFQQVSELIPYLIKQGNKRFAMPSANYLWPQLLNKATKKVIEANGGEVVLEEYFPLDQVEYSATIGKIKSEKVDHVFLTIIPPGLGPFGNNFLNQAGKTTGVPFHACTTMRTLLSTWNHMPWKVHTAVLTISTL